MDEKKLRKEKERQEIKKLGLNNFEQRQLRYATKTRKF